MIVRPRCCECRKLRLDPEFWTCDKYPEGEAPMDAVLGGAECRFFEPVSSEPRVDEKPKSA
jgi:hypothetical protein